VAAAVAAAAMLCTVFVGLEIDEQYALSLSYRLLRGDTLFYSMWEPHQLSALPAALPLALYMALTGGTDGVMLFFRLFMLAAKAALSIAFWRSFCKPLGEQPAFWGALALFVYTPKWFLGPDYTHQQFFCTAAAFLCLYAYHAPGPRRFRRPWLAVLGAVFACFSYLAFPQSIVSAAVTFAGLIVLGWREEPRLFRLPRGAALFLCGCVGCGAAFILYVLWGLGFDVPLLLARAGLILNDPQYNFTVAERLAMLGRQAVDVLKTLAKPAALGLAAGAWLVWRRREKPAETLLFTVSLCSVVWCLGIALKNASFDARQFLPLLCLLGGWAFWADRRHAALFWLGYLPGLAAYVFILRSSLIGFETTFMYLFWPALCGCMALDKRRRSCLLLACVTGFVVACRLCLVQTTGWKEHARWNTPLQKITAGPAAGLWADEREADRMDAFAAALEPYQGAALLQAIGEIEGLVFLMNDGTMTVAQASVISGTDSDPRFVTYYEELPEKCPTVVLYDHNEVRDMAAFHEWIEKNWTVTDRHTVTRGTAQLEVLEIQR